MTVLITLTTAGANTGPFNLYSNVDGFSSAFETGVAKVDLLAGYLSTLAPNGTSVVRVMSTSPLCPGFIDIIISSSICSSYTFVGGLEGGGQFTYVECEGDEIKIKLNTGQSVTVCAQDLPAPYVNSGLGTITMGEPCSTTTTTTLAP